MQNDLVILNSEIAFEVDCVMVCLGRKQVLPKINIQGVNEEFKLKPNVDGTCEVENFYVIGDCLNCEFLNFSSSYQAKSVMNKILFNKEIKLKNIPIILKTTPQTASIGLREQDVVGDLGSVLRGGQLVPLLSCLRRANRVPPVTEVTSGRISYSASRVEPWSIVFQMLHP